MQHFCQWNCIRLAIYCSTKTHKLIRIAIRGSISTGRYSGIVSGSDCRRVYSRTFVALGTLAIMELLTHSVQRDSRFFRSSRLDSLAMIPLCHSPRLCRHSSDRTSVRKIQPHTLRTDIDSQNVGYNNNHNDDYHCHLGSCDNEPLYSGCRGYTDRRPVPDNCEYFLPVIYTYVRIHRIMRGQEDTFIPMFFNTYSLWLIRVPLAYFLSKRIGCRRNMVGNPCRLVHCLSLAFLYYKTADGKQNQCEI